MSGNSDAVSRRTFLAVAGSTVVAASSFAVGKDSDSAQSTAPTIAVDYVVTIDVKTTPPTYHARDGHGHPVTLHNNGLPVNKTDSVTWEVDNGGKSYNLTVGFFKTPTTPLVDPHGRALYSVSGTEADQGTKRIGGTIGPTASGTYKYYVRADDANGSHPDDPTIIVGKLDTKEKLTKAKGELKEVRDKIDYIEKELGEVIDKLP
jgi:hypothetical protein